MSGELPPYSGERPCPKCGYNLVSTTYKASNYGGNVWGGFGMFSRKVPTAEEIRSYDYPLWQGFPIDAQLLERKCQRCGHGWPEAPLSPVQEGAQIARDVFSKEAS